MNARRWISYAVALFGMLLVSLSWMGDSVRADILLPNQKGLDYCFEVTGMDTYPDYVFLAYFSRATGGHTTIDTGKCVSFYKLALPMLYAMRKSVYATNQPPADRQGEMTYFTTNPNLLRSDIGIHHPGAVDKSDPVDGIVDVFHVASVDDSKLNVVPESVRYTFSDGTKETVPWTAGDRPTPRRATNSSSTTPSSTTGGSATTASSTTVANSTTRATVNATSSAGGGSTTVVTSGGPHGSRTRLLLEIFIPIVAVIGIIGVIVWQERQRAPRPPPRGE
jgi:hypothetical protein